MTKIPKKIKVGPFEYAVELLHGGQANAENVFGKANHNQRKIILADDNSEQQQKNTLLHEVIHAVWRVWGMDFQHEKDTEEQVVTVLANGLHTVMLDNPKLFSYLNGTDDD